MKNSSFRIYFILGMIANFLPFLLPNGFVLFLMPFISPLGIAVYGSFIFAAIQALRGKKGALGWVVGAIVSFVIGTTLYFSIGFNFVPV